MKKRDKIESVIKMLNSFISGTDRVLEIAGKIEVELDKLFPDDDDIQDFVADIASYRPGGGEYLYDELKMASKSEHMIKILESKLNECE